MRDSTTSPRVSVPEIKDRKSIHDHDKFLAMSGKDT